MAVKDDRHLCETCPSVPNEIIVEILLKLPVGLLLRCKSVCKLWHSLISDPYFIKSHLILSTCNPHYIHHRLISSYDFSSCRLYDVMFDKPISVVENSLFKHPRVSNNWIAGSCNGLLLISHNNNMFMWNPGTGRSSKVPYHGFGKNCGSYVLYGLGYDESTDDYKVVVIAATKLVKIYSLKFGTWKDCDNFPNGIYPMHSFGTYLNGTLHWAGIKNCGSWRIVSLDLENETFGEVLQPEYDDESGKALKLGVLRESMCVLRNYPKDRADVWVMKVYGVKDSWTKLVSVPYFTGHGIHDSVPLCISSDGKILLKLGNTLLQYDSKNNSVSHIPNLDVTGSFTHTFVESLVSPDPLSKITM